MKQSLYIILILLGMSVSAQMQDNRFDQTESSSDTDGGRFYNEPASEKIPTTNSNPGNPSDPRSVPIDDYLPLLVIAAVGIIIYNTHTRKRNAC